MIEIIILSLIGLTLQVNDTPESFVPFSAFCAGNTTGNFVINCGLNDNFVMQSLHIFNFITGGFLPLIFWGVICLSTYIKYQNFILSALIGSVIIGTSIITFPTQALLFYYMLMGTGVAVTIFILIWKIPRD